MGKRSRQAGVLESQTRGPSFLTRKEAECVLVVGGGWGGGWQNGLATSSSCLFILKMKGTQLRAGFHEETCGGCGGYAARGHGAITRG